MPRLRRDRPSFSFLSCAKSQFPVGHFFMQCSASLWSLKSCWIPRRLSLLLTHIPLHRCAKGIKVTKWLATWYLCIDVSSPRRLDPKIVTICHNLCAMIINNQSRIFQNTDLESAVLCMCVVSSARSNWIIPRIPSFDASSSLPMVFAAVASSRINSSNRRITRTTLPS